MKFLVTAVAISKNTRRRVGKSWTEVVDTDKDLGFMRCGDDPRRVEETYQRKRGYPWMTEDVKVVDVRPAPFVETVALREHGEQVFRVVVNGRIASPRWMMKGPADAYRDAVANGKRSPEFSGEKTHRLDCECADCQMARANTLPSGRKE